MANDENGDLAAHNALRQAALIDINTVKDLTAFKSANPIYSRIKDGTFPAPIRLSQRCSRWRLRDVLAWCEAQQSGATPA